MNNIRNGILALAAVVALGAQAQSPGTTQQEANRGVPGVDVDVGKNASGAIDINRSPNVRAQTQQGAPGVDVNVGRNANGAVDVNRERSNGSLPARADRG